MFTFYSLNVHKVPCFNWVIERYPVNVAVHRHYKQQQQLKWSKKYKVLEINANFNGKRLSKEN